MTNAQARIQRLRRAIGPGPHAKNFDPEQHLRLILSALRDKAAIAELDIDPDSNRQFILESLNQ